MSQATETRRGIHPAYVLFAALFAAQAVILVLSPILPQVADEFGISTASAAQLRSVSGITAGIAALILATTGNRFTLSSLLNAGLGLLALGSLASAWSPTFAVLLAAQVIVGLGLAAVVSGGLAASETWAAEGENAKNLSWALIGQPVAWIVGQPVVGLVAGQDWRWAWVAVPFLASLGALLAVALRDRSSGDSGQDCDPLGLWRQTGARSWAIGELAAFAAWAGTLVYAGAFFIESYDVSVGMTGLILGLGAVFYLPGNSLGRRLLRRGTGSLSVGFALAAAVGVAIFAVVDAGVVFSVVVFSVAVFFAAGRTIAGAAMGLEIADGRRLAAMSVRTAASQFGYLVGSAVGGLLLGTFGFAGIGWGFGLLFALAAIIHAPGAIRAFRAAVPADRYLRRHQPTGTPSAD